MESIYLDHAATTPLRLEVREAMAPYGAERFGNPSSAHRWGRQARNALEEARERIAAALGGKRREVVFTGGGTEADNIAVLGRWRSVCRDTPDGAAPTPHDVRRVGTPVALTPRDVRRAGAPVVVCSAVEHKAVSSAAKQAAAEGAELIILGVDAEGRVDPSAVDEAIAARPCIVSVMWGNNEIGTLQPVHEIGERCRASGVVFHTDAVQAMGKVRVHVDEAQCDLLSLSGHKIGGPKGIGCLYVRDGADVSPLTHGGGQERQLRPGTENVASAVGFAFAVELAASEQEEETARLAALRDALEAGLRERIPELLVNGGGAQRLPHVSNVTVPGVDQEGLLIGLDLEGLAVSGASACQSGSVEPSSVLVAMGRVEPGASIRMSLGRTTTRAEIERAVDIFPWVVDRVRTPARI